MDILQDAIVMQAAVMELKGDPIGLVEGHIVEAKSDCKRGSVLAMHLMIEISLEIRLFGVFADLVGVSFVLVLLCYAETSQ